MDAVLWLIAFLLALAPGVVLLWYIRRLDKYEPEPWSLIGIAFVAGCISVVPAFFIELALKTNVGGFWGTLYSAFIVAAMTEELCKGTLAMTFMWRKPQFNEVLDGIVYFGVAHMGFAITENLVYIFLNSDGNIVRALMTGFLRTTTAVPLHVISGMIMGYHVGVAKFARSSGERWKNLAQAVFIPILLHGIYDVAAFNQDTSNIQDIGDLFRVGFGSALMYAAVVALWVVLLPRVKKAQEASPWRPQDWPTLPVAPTGCPGCGSAYPMGANYCHICGTVVAQQEYYPPTGQSS
ncbi:MAG TPA: PrsW family glutamic-type intramembrane protease [Symbiobacteriaceae bacterium]|nr:PrsW family glutamic-type intramembrane protease [Symbiobacteriaceae bacterium]